MLYALINSRIERKESEQMLTLKEMQDLVGFPGEPAYIEAVYHHFADTDIVLICDEEFLLKDCKPTCRTRKGLILHGQVLAMTVSNDGGFASLTEKQFEAVKAGLRLFNH
jgi:hypothetical protein